MCTDVEQGSTGLDIQATDLLKQGQELTRFWVWGGEGVVGGETLEEVPQEGCLLQVQGDHHSRDLGGDLYLGVLDQGFGRHREGSFFS